MIATAVAEASSVRHVNNVTDDGERGALALRPIRIKPRHRGTYGHRPAGVGCARVDVEGKDLVPSSGHLRVEEERARSKINDRRAGDPERINIPAREDLTLRPCRHFAAR